MRTLECYYLHRENMFGMGVAKLLKVSLLLVIFSLMTACSITKEFVAKVTDNKPAAAITPQHESQGSLEDFAWLDGYISKINDMDEASLLLELEKNKQETLAHEPSHAKVKLLLTLVLLPGVEVDKQTLSLLGDIVSEGDVQQQLINILYKSYIDSLDRINDLREENKKGVAEKRQIKQRFENSQEQLKTVSAEKAKLEQQLVELKSIEASLIERDMLEEVNKP